jgi:HD-GYP domain-containing protein (c-di-GMP phosphodiesterase class II)
MCEHVRTASLLHDLGKVGVRDAILDKPGPLTPEEWTAMRQHPVTGWKILGPLGFLAEEARSVRHHHERFDGGGYPDGLAGNAIPLPARIIAVADAFDAMRTVRPYRPPLPLEKALAELEGNAGKQFDPTVVDAFQTWFGARSAGGRAI